jgi:hypothetical protein
MEAPVATGYDPLRDHEPALAQTMAASVQQRIACGERAGQPVRRIGSGFGAEGEAPRLTGPRCASVNGFSLHANTAIPAHRRDQLERLIRYTARGAVALERLQEDANGDLVYTFTHPWADKARHGFLYIFAASSRLCLRNCSSTSKYAGERENTRSTRARCRIDIAGLLSFRHSRLSTRT